jgi:hypothetical protein
MNSPLMTQEDKNTPRGMHPASDSCARARPPRTALAALPLLLAGLTGCASGNCETNIDECASLPCQNGGVCQDGINAYTCFCPPGFTGTSCETNINDCAGSPCLHGGTCADQVNGYTCHCAAGYTGNNCEIDINDCANNPCQNGGICVDGIDSHTCSCQGGYSGTTCEVPPVPVAQVAAGVSHACALRVDGIVVC